MERSTTLHLSMSWQFWTWSENDRFRVKKIKWHVIFGLRRLTHLKIQARSKLGHMTWTRPVWSGEKKNYWTTAAKDFIFLLKFEHSRSNAVALVLVFSASSSTLPTVATLWYSSSLAPRLRQSLRIRFVQLRCLASASPLWLVSGRLQLQHPVQLHSNLSSSILLLATSSSKGRKLEGFS